MIIDFILKLTKPLEAFTNQNWDNNYILFAVGGAFIGLWALIIYIGYLVFFV